MGLWLPSILVVKGEQHAGAQSLARALANHSFAVAEAFRPFTAGEISTHSSPQSGLKCGGILGPHFVLQQLLFFWLERPGSNKKGCTEDKQLEPVRLSKLGS